MKNNDVEQLEIFFSSISHIIGKINKAVMCSPDPREISLVRRHFRADNVVELDRKAWDINKTCPEESDMVMACNVFMESPDPLLWINNACARTKWFVILDNCISHRGNIQGETAVSIGDVMRYTMPPIMVAKLPTAFDLNTISDRIIKIVPYDLESHCGVEGYHKATSFIALIKGNRV